MCRVVWSWWYCRRPKQPPTDHTYISRVVWSALIFDNFLSSGFSLSSFSGCLPADSSALIRTLFTTVSEDVWKPRSQAVQSVERSLGITPSMKRLPCRVHRFPLRGFRCYSSPSPAFGRSVDLDRCRVFPHCRCSMSSTSEKWQLWASLSNSRLS